MHGAIGGVLAGASTLFIGLVACVGYSWILKTDVTIPGVFAAWFTTDNDTTALNFIPNGTGMLMVIAGLAAFFALDSVRRSRKAAPQAASR